MTKEAQKILQEELYKLSPLAQEVVNELIVFYNERHTLIEAEQFIYELTEIPLHSQETNASLISKLNLAIDVLRNSERWFSIEDLPHEIWRNVVSYEEFYQVSIFGRVKSFYGREARILKHQIDLYGYAVVSLSQNAKDRVFGIHTLVARAFIDNPEQKPEVNHIDGIKKHSCVWNLEWVTYSENARHAVKQGLRKVGSENPCAKLTAEQAKEILRLYIKGSHEFGIYGLAKKFNVHPMTINSIILGKTYKNIPRIA